ncbi:hypothetical protein IscW_ISCW015229 [Ixodes scapularis]|uniref:Uncharacterized protein n=1 Tax=Ixodes scapularis TaxID=6945 RepID=B7QN72_IXOSC|nr:hypothetical protein IscW_ISCW015229 [Ixodes scapularis]|eukprot:XP_002400752.1 hypothetical protein IscW_ISCW015229 [Ixodes scapularis]
MDTPGQFCMKSYNLSYKDSGKLKSLGSRTSSLKSSQRKMDIFGLAEFTHERFELAMRNKSGMSTTSSIGYIDVIFMRTRHASPNTGRGVSISRCADADVSYVIGRLFAGCREKREAMKLDSKMWEGES